MESTSDWLRQTLQEMGLNCKVPRACWDEHFLACMAAADEIDSLRAALNKISNGDGYYGAQAREYKQIARDAVKDAEDSASRKLGW